MGKHSEWRRLIKKLRRKRIRQNNAIKRHKLEEEECFKREQSPSYADWLQKQKEAEEFEAQEEARLAAQQEANWLKIEEEAQKQWCELQFRLKLAHEERAKQNARIRLEWEREQQRLKELKELKEKEEEERIKQQELLKQQIDNFISNGGVIPQQLKVSLETNPNKEICQFFQKTGACRFKDTCSRNHKRPGISKIILIPNFYSHYSLEQTENEYGNDSLLEYEIHETYQHFTEFFYDVIPEIEKFGTIVQFKVCCNREPHLRGNVYIEFSTSREAIRSYKALQGRWYGGKQLNVEFCKIDSWKSAICGLHFKNRCPKGSACNFLHVFHNPNNLFNKIDKEFDRSTSRFDYDSDDDHNSSRHWRWSESPERLPTIEKHDKKYEYKKRSKNKINSYEKCENKRRHKRIRSHSSSRSSKKHTNETSSRSHKTKSKSCVER